MPIRLLSTFLFFCCIINNCLAQTGAVPRPNRWYVMFSKNSVTIGKDNVIISQRIMPDDVIVVGKDAYLSAMSEEGQTFQLTVPGSYTLESIAKFEKAYKFRELNSVQKLFLTDSKKVSSTWEAPGILPERRTRPIVDFICPKDNFVAEDDTIRFSWTIGEVKHLGSKLRIATDYPKTSKVIDATGEIVVPVMSYARAYDDLVFTVNDISEKYRQRVYCSIRKRSYKSDEPFFAWRDKLDQHFSDAVPEQCFTKALIYVSAGDFFAAVRYLRKAAGLDPSSKLFKDVYEAYVDQFVWRPAEVETFKNRLPMPSLYADGF